MLRFVADVLWIDPEGYNEPDEGFNEGIKVHVEVKAIIIRPEERRTEMSNSFLFSYIVPSIRDITDVPTVLPTSEKEARRIISFRQEQL